MYFCGFNFWWNLMWIEVDVKCSWVKWENSYVVWLDIELVYIIIVFYIRLYV